AVQVIRVRIEEDVGLGLITVRRIVVDLIVLETKGLGEIKLGRN
ncbi:hypothetical protein A2U01_0090183, partial [Trifolium medium]|nr:hypothetical protein [Trifolium medium]